MFKQKNFFKNLIFCILLLLILGIILVLIDSSFFESIGIGIISSCIVSIIIWLFQFQEQLKEKTMIRKNLYWQIKNEILIKVMMCNKFILDKDKSFCLYLNNLIEMYKDKGIKKENLTTFDIDFIKTMTNKSIFSKYTEQILLLLSFSLSNNIIAKDEYKNLNTIFQFENSIQNLLIVSDSQTLCKMFSNYLDCIKNEIMQNKEFIALKNLQIKNDKFFLSKDIFKQLEEDDKLQFINFLEK